MHDEQMIKIGELNEREGQFFSMTTKTTMTISGNIARHKNKIEKREDKSALVHSNVR